MQVLHEIIEKETGYKVQSTDRIYDSGYHRRLKRSIVFLIVFIIAILFLPWTQNIRSMGTVTTLYQGATSATTQRYHSRTNNKMVCERRGLCEEGDTLIMLADVKDDYLDPKVVQRTQEQLDAKQQKIDYYPTRYKPQVGK